MNFLRYTCRCLEFHCGAGCVDYFGAFEFSERFVCPILRYFAVGILVDAAIDISPMMVWLYDVCLR